MTGKAVFGAHKRVIRTRGGQPCEERSLSAVHTQCYVECAPHVVSCDGRDGHSGRAKWKISRENQTETKGALSGREPCRKEAHGDCHQTTAEEPASSHLSGARGDRTSE